MKGPNPSRGGSFWRYFVPLATFAVIGIMLPLVLVIPSQRSFVRERARADAVATAELAGRVLAATLASGKTGELKDAIAALRRSSDAFGWMVVASPAGRIIADTDKGQEGKLAVDLFPPPVSTVVKTMPGSDGLDLEITLPLTSGSELRGTLRTAMRVQVPASSWGGVDYLGALTACLLGLACLLSLHLARTQTKPPAVVRERALPERVEEKPPPPVAPASTLHTDLLAAVIDATPAGLFVVDEVTRRIHHANGAFCRLWNLESLQDQLRAGAVDYETVAARCNAATDQVVLPALGAADVDPLRLVDEELRCRDGRIVRCFSLPLTVGGSHLRLYVHSDVTAERRREQDLTQAAAAARAAFQEKAAFSAQVSRTLRAPLHGLLGTIGLLLDTKLTAQQSTYGETVRTSVEDVLGMVNNLLDLTAIDAGELHPASSPFGLQSLVHEALEPFALAAYRKNIDLAIVIAETLPRGFNGDCDRLRQILSNLVSSAVNATDHGEVVVDICAAPADVGNTAAGLRIATDGSRTRAAARQAPAPLAVRFEVRDTGRRISADEQASLFQLLGAPAADARYRTHLPLLVAKRLVELMGGHIGVESDPGRGNTLWFTVPLQVDDSAKDHPVPAVDAFNDTRVLVVDDNATVRALLERELRAWHITADIVANGHEALRMLRAALEQGTPYNLAIIDAQMPEMDGLQLVEAIRNELRLVSMPVFLLTSSPQISGDTYPGIAVTLSKPVHPPSLHQALAAHLGAKTGERRTLTLRTGASRTAGPRGRLLLAEDNLVNQKIALRMLDKLGYQTDVVTNGTEAVEAAARVQYDAILMDCQMPEMDGVTATTVIRQREGTERHVPIIAVTANSLEVDRERCLAAGMDDFLAKPVRSAEIEAVLARWSPRTVPESAALGAAAAHIG